MKTTLIFLITLLNLNSSISKASAILHLNGKIVSFNEKEVSLETQTSLYRIDRKALGKETSEQITKSNVMAAFDIPMTSVISVKKLAKKK